MLVAKGSASGTGQKVFTWSRVLVVDDDAVTRHVALTLVRQFG